MGQVAWHIQPKQTKDPSLYKGQLLRLPSDFHMCDLSHVFAHKTQIHVHTAHT